MSHLSTDLGGWIAPGPGRSPAPAARAGPGPPGPAGRAPPPPDPPRAARRRISHTAPAPPYTPSPRASPHCENISSSHFNACEVPMEYFECWIDALCSRVQGRKCGEYLEAKLVKLVKPVKYARAFTASQSRLYHLTHTGSGSGDRGIDTRQ